MMKPVNSSDVNGKQFSQEKLNNINQPFVRHKKKLSKKLIALSVGMIVFFSIFFIAFYLGFVPIGLSVIEPIGNAKTVNVNNLMNEFPSIAEMPNLDKIEYKAFDTDASVNDVIDSYESNLFSEGYSLKYSGSVELDGITFEVRGYLKGITAVGILTTDEITEKYDSLVLYSTGNALDFQEIINWYQDN